MKMDLERKTFDLQINESYDKICGEILLTTFRRIAFKCTQCDSKYRNVQGFLTHLYVRHLFPSKNSKNNEDSSRVNLNRSMNVRENGKHLEAETKHLSDVEIRVFNDEESSLEEKDPLDTLIAQSKETLKNNIQDPNVTDLAQKKHIKKGKNLTPNNPNEKSESITKKKETDIQNEDNTNVTIKILVQENCIGKVQSRPSLLFADERKHKCPICGLGFKMSYNMQRHAKRHSAQKDQQCPQCEKKFDTSEDVQHHMASQHKGERPFICSVCSKAFYTAVQLNHHMKRHSSGRPFKCLLCHETFARKEGLMNHIRLHENKREYKCQLCDSEFNQKSGLYSHMRRFHKMGVKG